MAFNAMELCVKIFADDSEVQKTVGGLGDKLGGALGTAAKVGAAAIGAATAAVGGFAVSSLKAGADFDTAMSQVAATSGKSISEIQNLRDFAQEMGSTTAFSATQAAEALNYMALAGYSDVQSMEMLPTVLNLAAAGAMDLASASDMVTDVQSALGLSMEEAADMTDVWAKTASTTNTSVSQMGDAFLTVGALLPTVNMSVDDASKVLGILADNGIKGSEAGTHLRNMILSLSAPTEKAAGLLEDLGVTTVDSSGNMLEMEDILGQLGTALDGVGSSDRADAISTIFNTTDVAAVNALLNTNSERWDEVGNAIANAGGAAEEMANTQMDNLEGDLTLFSSALEGLQIAVSDALSPALREFVQFGSSSLSAITEGFQSGDMETVFASIGDLVGQLATKLAENLPQMVEAGIQLLGAIIEGLVSAAPQLGEAGLTIAESLWTAIADNLTALFPEAEGLLGDLANTFTTVFDQIVGIVENAWELIQVAWDTYGAIILELTSTVWEAISAVIEGVLTIIQGIINVFTGILTGNWRLAWDGIKSILEGAWNIMVALINTVVAVIQATIDAVLTTIKALWDTAWTAIKDKLTEIWENIKGTVEELAKGVSDKIHEVKETITTKIGEAVDYIKGLPAQALTWGRDLIQNFIDGIKEKIADLKETVSGVADSVRDFIGFSEPKLGPLSNFHTYAPDMMQLFADGINANKNLITDAIQNSFDLGPTIAGATGQQNAMNITQNIYSKAMTASELMREAVWEQERAVLAGV